MQKFLVYLSALLFCGTLGLAQHKKAETIKSTTSNTSTQPIPQDTIPIELKIYSNASYFLDYEVAKYAVYELISKYPQRLDYIDTLARIYFALGTYPQSIAAANVVLTNQPDNYPLMEIAAIAQNALNNHKEALLLYEKIYAHSKHPVDLYQVAVQQYSLQRFAESKTSIETMLTDSNSLAQKIRFTYDQNNTQEVPLAAAGHNLKGVVEKELNNKENAIVEFNTALKIFPNFNLAKNNLEKINTPASDEKGKGKKK